MTNVEYHGTSITGRRENNQDAFLAEKLSEQTFIFAVADGMGGTTGGEIASHIALESLIESVNTEIEKSGPAPRLKPILRESVMHASSSIRDIIENQKNLTGMGTTLSILLIHKKRYAIAHIGDSRVYLSDGASLRQLTTDHTYIEDYKQKNNGVLPEDIKRRYGHYLLKALTGPPVEPDLLPLRGYSAALPPGGAFLICSDGLINDKDAVNTNLFNNYLVGTTDCRTASEQLTAYAFHHDSPDNITALVISFGQFPRKELNLKCYPVPGTVQVKVPSSRTGFVRKLFDRLRPHLPLITLALFVSLVLIAFMLLNVI